MPAVALALAFFAFGCHSSGPGLRPPPPDGSAADPTATDPGVTEARLVFDVPTQHNDALRVGAHLYEKSLATTNVSPATFGKLFTRAVDGQLYAQPLYVSGLMVGGARRNVVFLATEHNSVYAYDADDPARSDPLWQVNLGPPVPSSDYPCPDLIPEIGITATPVIDRMRGTIYVSAKTKEQGVWKYRLHALELTTGVEKAGSPVEIKADVPGTGDMTANGRVVFNAQYQLNRPALLLSKGAVYLAFGSHCDSGTYHGWLLAYDARTLAQVGIYNTTPNGAQGSIWQSGQGPAADEDGNLFVVTGNGDVETNGGTMLSQSLIKLSPSLKVLDWFTPWNYDLLNQSDVDLGSAGVLVIPGTHIVITGGKEGKLYLVDRTNMSHFHADADQILQTVPVITANVHGTPIYWRGPAAAYVYVWAEYDRLKQYVFTGGTLLDQPVAQSAMTAPDGMPGGFLTVSSDGATPGTGIVWAAHPLANANPATVPGILRAFDASDVSKELWNSELKPERDAVGNFAKFAAPTVANGKVYLPTFSGVLDVYGLLGN